MTTRFHINKNGIPSLCKAKIGNCPLGGNDIHFKTPEEAQIYIDSKNAEEFGLLGNSVLLSKRHHINRFQRIDDLVEAIGSKTVLKELCLLINDNHKNKINDFIIKTYEINNLNNNLSSQDKITKLAEIIDNEPVIYQISKQLKSSELHNKIDYIEDKFNVSYFKRKQSFDEYTDVMLENKLEHLTQALENRLSDESVDYLNSEIEEVKREINLRSSNSDDKFENIEDADNIVYFEDEIDITEESKDNKAISY